MRIPEKHALAFITRNLSDGMAQFRADVGLTTFFALVEQGKEIAAAQEYARVTGAGLPESHFAAVAAKHG